MITHSYNTDVYLQCGYSLATLRLLEASGAEDIKDVNVLEDKELRSGIKKYRLVRVDQRFRILTSSQQMADDTTSIYIWQVYRGLRHRINFVQKR